MREQAEIDRDKMEYMFQKQDGECNEIEDFIMQKYVDLIKGYREKP